MKRDLPTCVYKQGSRYCAQVRRQGRARYLGSFKTPEQAAERVSQFNEQFPKNNSEWHPGDPMP